MGEAGFVDAVVVGVVEATGGMGGDVVGGGYLAVGVGADVGESVAFRRVRKVFDGAVGADGSSRKERVGWCRIEGGSGVDEVEVEGGLGGLGNASDADEIERMFLGNVGEGGVGENTVIVVAGWCRVIYRHGDDAVVERPGFGVEASYAVNH